MNDAQILAGPLLLLRGSLGPRWRLSVLFVISGETEPDDLRVDGVSLAVPPRHVAGWRDQHVWRFDFAVTPGEEETRVGYGFIDHNTHWAFTLPAAGNPQRIGYLAGAGVGKGGGLFWRQLAARHRARPFHLLLLGGGQIDGSQVWHDCRHLSAWFREHGLGVAATEADRLTEDMAEEAMDFFLSRYVQLLQDPATADLLATVPTVASWDDHETYTGFSRMNAEQRKTRPVRGVHLVARRWFSLFQLGATDDALPDSVWTVDGTGLNQGFRVGDLGILALDMVSERRRDRMLSDATWSQLPDWLSRFAGCRDLIVMSARPLLLPAPIVPQWLPDPLQNSNGGAADHWRAAHHQAEWHRALRLLLGFAEHADCRVTILSGVEGAEAPLAPLPAHPAGFQGWLEAPGATLRQIVSSAMEQRRPGKFAVKLTDRRGRATEYPQDNWRLSFSPAGDGGSPYIRRRNWLNIERHDDSGLDVLWYADDEGRAEAEAERFTLDEGVQG